MAEPERGPEEMTVRRARPDQLPEGPGRRRDVLIGFFAVSMVAAGCSGFPKKKSAPIPSPPPTGSTEPFWNDAQSRVRPGAPAVNVPASGGDVTPVSAEGTSILAGRVLDPQRSSPGIVYVQVQASDGPGGQPVEVESDAQGHFIVRGLSSARQYRLVARTKRDGRMLAGEVVATPPDTRLLIALGDQLASSATPPLPAAGQSAEPTGPAAAAELGPPRAGGDFYPPPAPDSLAAADASGTPRANIPAPGLPDTAPSGNPEWARVNGPVPDCLVANGRVLTLRLTDPDGRVWDLSQREGRLILIDLWGTWCGPCLRAVPELARLQSQYRTRGLEVIGIACEKGSAAENAARVHSARRRLTALNYRVLMAGEPDRDPVRTQFRPGGFPALYLLDSDGTIVWRGVGTDSFAELEPIIRARLDGR